MKTTIKTRKQTADARSQQDNRDPERLDDRNPARPDDNDSDLAREEELRHAENQLLQDIQTPTDHARALDDHVRATTNKPPSQTSSRQGRPEGRQSGQELILPTKLTVAQARTVSFSYAYVKGSVLFLGVDNDVDANPKDWRAHIHTFDDSRVMWLFRVENATIRDGQPRTRADDAVEDDDARMVVDKSSPPIAPVTHGKRAAGAFVCPAEPSATRSIESYQVRKVPASSSSSSSSSSSKASTRSARSHKSDDVISVGSTRHSGISDDDPLPLRSHQPRPQARKGLKSADADSKDRTIAQIAALSSKIDTMADMVNRLSQSGEIVSPARRHYADPASEKSSRGKRAHLTADGPDLIKAEEPRAHIGRLQTDTAGGGTVSADTDQLEREFHEWESRAHTRRRERYDYHAGIAPAYAGKCDESLNEFRRAMERAQVMNQWSDTDVKMRLLSHLGEPAASTLMDMHGKLRFMTLTQVWERLESAHDPHAARVDKEDIAFEHTVQKPDERVGVFLDRFERAAQRAQKSDSERVLRFRRNARQDVRAYLLVKGALSWDSTRSAVREYDSFHHGNSAPTQPPPHTRGVTVQQVQYGQETAPLDTDQPSSGDDEIHLLAEDFAHKIVSAVSSRFGGRTDGVQERSDRRGAPFRSPRSSEERDSQRAEFLAASECFQCGKKGHLRDTCPALSAEERQQWKERGEFLRQKRISTPRSASPSPSDRVTTVSLEQENA